MVNKELNILYLIHTCSSSEKKEDPEATAAEDKVNDEDAENEVWTAHWTNILDIMLIRNIIYINLSIMNSKHWDQPCL